MKYCYDKGIKYHEDFEDEFNEHFSYFEKLLGIPYVCCAVALHKDIMWGAYSIKEWQEYSFKKDLHSKNPAHKQLLTGKMSFLSEKTCSANTEEERWILEERRNFLKMNELYAFIVRDRIKPGSVETLAFSSDSKTHDLLEVINDNRAKIFNRWIEMREIHGRMHDKLTKNWTFKSRPWCTEA